MLKTEFLGLNYHPNPATNEDEVDAEKYFNENYFTIDANAKKMREKINYLSAQQPWNTVQGESIHIQDSALWDENKLSLSGNMKQEKREGYNIIPNNLVSGETDGVKYVVNKDKSIVLNGTATKTVILTLNNSNIKVNPGTYKLSGCPTGGSDNTYKLDLILKNTVTSAVRYPKDLGSGYVIEAVNEEIITTTRIVVYSGATLSNLVFKPMLTLKTTEDKPYEQYGAMPSTEFPSMPLVCSGVQKIRQFGKNWAKINESIYTLSGDIIKAIGVQGTYNGKELTRVKLKANILYKINIKFLSKPTKSTTFTASIDNNKNETLNITNFNTYNVNQIYTITYTPTKDEELSYALWGNSNNDNFEFQFWIEKDVVTSYEPYTEEIHTLDLGTTELCKMTDSSGNLVAQDRPVYRNGKWQWEKNVGKYVFDGTENWTIDKKQSSCNYYSFFSKPGTIKEYSNVVANLFKEDDTIYSTDNLGIYVNYVGAVRIKNGVSTTVAELKTWLSTNNLIAYCVLATPTYTDCTAQQSAVLDKLYNNFKLNKGVNNVIIESDNGVGVNMQLDYMQDNVLRHDKDIAELKQAIVALGGVI